MEIIYKYSPIKTEAELFFILTVLLNNQEQ